MKKQIILYIVLFFSMHQLSAQKLNRFIIGIETVPTIQALSSDGIGIEGFAKARLGKLPFYVKLGAVKTSREENIKFNNLHDLKLNGFALKSGIYFQKALSKSIGFFVGGNYVYSKANIEGVFKLDARYWETYESPLLEEIVHNGFEGELGLEAKIFGGFFVSSSLRIANFIKFKDYQLNDPGNTFYYEHIPGMGDITSNTQNTIVGINVTLLYKLY